MKREARRRKMRRRIVIAKRKSTLSLFG